MESVSQFKPTFWDMFIEKYFNSSSVIASDTGDFTFPVSDNFIHELKDSFSVAKVEKYENGPAYSAYYVKYDIGGQKGEAIFKATTTTYPDFTMYDTLDEYEMSFSLD